MGQFRSRRRRSQTDLLRAKNRIRFFRAGICLQLAHTVLVIALISDIDTLRYLVELLPPDIFNVTSRLHVLLVFGTPLMTMWLLFQTNFGQVRIGIWFMVIISLFAFHLFAIPHIVYCLLDVGCAMSSKVRFPVSISIGMGA